MKTYDFVIIGGGVGGLVAASGASQLGARVALVDKTLQLGGDCLNYGCVPTKRLVASAKVASILKRSGEFGVRSSGVEVDFAAVMESMRSVQKKIGENDDPERFRKMGVDVHVGAGRFTGPSTFEVEGEGIRGRKFLIATGSRPVFLPIPGIEESGTLTNETALELTRLPSTIAIMGAGPVGVEYAQVFARLGSKVTLLEKKGQILPREDAEMAGALHDILTAEGIEIVTCTEFKDVKSGSGGKSVTARCPMGDSSHDMDFEAEEVMLAIGRGPNVADLGLDAAGVEYDERRGIKVDSTLRTANKRIYACGDVIGHYAFTHMAEYQAGIVISNALFPFVNRKVDYGAVPWTTFTDPELARVGLTEAEATEKLGDKVHVYRHYFRDTDRAVIEGEGKGLIKLVCDHKARLLGAHILGPGAGELLGEYVLAMQNGLPITKISRTIHTYPTVSQAVKRAADRYYAEKLFGGWFAKLARWLIRRGG